VNADSERPASWPVAFDREDRLPATELKLAVGDRDGHTLADEHRPNVAVGVVVDLVVLPAVVSNEVIECSPQIIEQAGFGLVTTTPIVVCWLKMVQTPLASSGSVAATRSVISRHSVRLSVSIVSEGIRAVCPRA